MGRRRDARHGRGQCDARARSWTAARAGCPAPRLPTPRRRPAQRRWRWRRRSRPADRPRPRLGTAATAGQGHQRYACGGKGASGKREARQAHARPAGSQASIGQGGGGRQDAGGWGERPRAPGLAKGANSRHGAGFVASCSRIRRRTGPGGGAPARAAVTTIKAQARGRRRSGTRTGGPERAAAPAILRSLPQEAPARPAPPRARRRIRTNVQGVRRVPASGRMRIRAPARRNSMSLT